MRRGQTYTSSYLNKSSSTYILRHDVIKKSYGYHITIITSYVTIKKIRLQVNKDGSAKATMKVDKNYHPKHQVTYYFDCEGKEIISANNSTRAELAEYKRCRKQQA